MIKKLTVLFGLSLMILLSINTLAHASEPQHFKGEPSKTLEQAVKNLSIYNKKLAVLMQKDQLTPVDMAEIHQLSYTLENALERMEDELEIIEDLLEDVHLASEQADYDKALKQGRKYLDKIQILVP